MSIHIFRECYGFFPLRERDVKDESKLRLHMGWGPQRTEECRLGFPDLPVHRNLLGGFELILSLDPPALQNQSVLNEHLNRFLY